jgi:hypothetical protein
MYSGARCGATSRVEYNGAMASISLRGSFGGVCIKESYSPQKAMMMMMIIAVRV